MPFHSNTDDGWKLLPVTVRFTLPQPATLVAGASWSSTGTGGGAEADDAEADDVEADDVEAGGSLLPPQAAKEPASASTVR